MQDPTKWVTSGDFRAGSGEAWLVWWALSLVLWFKSTLEERWMLAQHPGYAHYREQTKRFVPWVY